MSTNPHFRTINVILAVIWLFVSLFVILDAGLGIRLVDVELKSITRWVFWILLIYFIFLLLPRLWMRIVFGLLLLISSIPIFLYFTVVAFGYRTSMKREWDFPYHTVRLEKEQGFAGPAVYYLTASEKYLWGHMNKTIESQQCNLDTDTTYIFRTKAGRLRVECCKQGVLTDGSIN